MLILFLLRWLPFTAIQKRDNHRSFDKTCYHEISNFYTYKINEETEKQNTLRDGPFSDKRPWLTSPSHSDVAPVLNKPAAEFPCRSWATPLTNCQQQGSFHLPESCCFFIWLCHIHGLWNRMENHLKSPTTFGTAASLLQHFLMGVALNWMVIWSSIFSSMVFSIFAKLLIKLLRWQKVPTFGSTNTLVVVQKISPKPDSL